jgi:hypothetical protein
MISGLPMILPTISNGNVFHIVTVIGLILLEEEGELY